ncbi:cobalt/nickel transport system ATP-binding protein [Desulfonauticus submarinus]|uniref:Cobalt/nickel transport system ATP-binding protein n=1 Tax=Desulfonauticus submarinus TaxID=206665 RepID=A0A1H0E7Q9_9BACT|nr:ABC transporter ATP-binding protein [Desulfonauticus submarinus]SDN78341.1 cobalt/nickel transport system ATP-binding protein [Desulfonauticus submarinus]
MCNSLIQLKNVSFGYKKTELILEKINFCLQKNEKIGLIGPNGSGKTTLVFLMVGLLLPLEGEIILFGKKCIKEKDFQQIRPKIGFVFQNADDQLIFPTVLEDVAFGPLNLGFKPQKALKIAQKTLEKLGIADLGPRNIFNLSGGEKKLVSIATVLSMSPQVLILDEPTTGLDEHSRSKLIEILKKLDIAYIIISHDYDFLARITKKQYILRDKQVIYDPTIVLHKHEHAHPLGYIPHRHENK